MATTRRVIPFAELGRQDVGRVGGTNASLGEMTAHLASTGVRVPPGFATTADAYGELLGGHGLRGRIDEQLGRLHAGHWSRKAKRCAERNADSLKHRPVWLFSSGPVDSSAEQHDIPPVRAVAQQMERLGAREHVTFGGSITAHTPGLIAKALVRQGKGGDFRNPERIQTWAHHISDELASLR
jgi:hypothetical protein